jgi:hypothetical protein
MLGVAACGGGDRRAVSALPPAQVSTLGINTFLWRAALETVGFMPILQADSNGGVILTDWYVNPQVPAERVKVSVFVLDKDLRADAIRVNALRQEVQQGRWVDVPVRAGTVQKLEEAILTRARLIRQGATARAD